MYTLPRNFGPQTVRARKNDADSQLASIISQMQPLLDQAAQIQRDYYAAQQGVGGQIKDLMGQLDAVLAQNGLPYDYADQMYSAPAEAWELLNY
jgi:hypothetical protein